MKTKLAVIACAAGLFSASSASAITVGVELALLTDISSSINRTEYKLQLDGYEAAFRNAGIHSLIEATPGGIAVTYVEWASSQNQRIGWTHITDAASAESFADTIASFWDPTFPGDGGKSVGLGTLTNVAGAIRFGADLFAGNGFEGVKKVIDVSGDGKDNVNPNDVPPFPKTDFDASGNETLLAGAYAIGLGIDSINGLPILTPGSTNPEVVGLDDWYLQYVAQGTDAFIVVANDYDDEENSFATAILQKLEREITVDEVPDNGSTIFLMGFGAIILASVRRWRNK